MLQLASQLQKQNTEQTNSFSTNATNAARATTKTTKHYGGIALDFKSVQPAEGGDNQFGREQSQEGVGTQEKQ